MSHTQYAQSHAPPTCSKNATHTGNLHNRQCNAKLSFRIEKSVLLSIYNLWHNAAYYHHWRCHSFEMSKQLPIYACSGYVATLAFLWSRVSNHMSNISLIFTLLLDVLVSVSSSIYYICSFIHSLADNFCLQNQNRKVESRKNKLKEAKMLHKARGIILCSIVTLFTVIVVIVIVVID